MQTSYKGLTVLRLVHPAAHGRNGQGVFRYLAPRWGVALLTFMGVLAVSGWVFDTHYHNLWAVVTIAVVAPNR